MIHNSAPLHIFKIAELARPIADQLVLSDGRSAANLSCACRCLEDPVLSALWATQPSLYTLLKVLPEGDWHIEDILGRFRAVRGPDLLSE